jgi:phosphatidylinositol dimannoside acyltransferase
VADAFATTIAERPEDWHMLGRIWSDVPPDPPADAPPADPSHAAAPSLAEEPA